MIEPVVINKSKLKKWIIRTLIGIAVFVGLYTVLAFVYYLYVTVRFSNKIPKSPIANTPQVWAHKGYHKGVTPNSLKAVQKAHESGVDGIEIDVHFDLELNRFVVSHNKPYRKHNGRLLFLEDVFKTSFKGYYWLDFKNISEDNLSAAANRAKLLINRFELKGRLFFESWHRKEISVFSNMGFQTLYWMSLEYETGSFKHFQEVFAIKSLVVKSNFVALSGNYENFLKYSTGTFEGFPIFLFTLNDKKLINKFFEDQNVKVILTDNPDCYTNHSNIQKDK